MSESLLLEPLLARALLAKRESKAIEFKRQFDPSATRDWMEIVKDVIAMANSGGGVIVVGLDSSGTPQQVDVSGLLELDPAVIADKIFSCSGVNFTDVHVKEVQKDGCRLAAILINQADTPMVFAKMGSSAAMNGKQDVAFHRGTCYMRHNAKSEPATTEDIRLRFEAQMTKLRKELMAGVKRVVQAPAGSKIEVVPPGPVTAAFDATGIRIRIVDDKDAPIYGVVDIDNSHPYRGKEVIEYLRDHLPDTRITQFTIVALRRAHNIESNPKYFRHPKFSSPRYSQSFVDWVVEKCKVSPGFLEETVKYLKSQAK